MVSELQILLNKSLQMIEHYIFYQQSLISHEQCVKFSFEELELLIIT